MVIKVNMERLSHNNNIEQRRKYNAMSYFTLDYNKVRSSGLMTKISEIQLESIEAILKECQAHAITLKTQVAYILATALHESYLKPITEQGSMAYLKSKPYYNFIGRGFVQLTWQYNYKKQGDRLGIDLVNNPERALEIPIAANILVHGMKYGEFTGKKLSDYITIDKTDFPNARRIINGKDKMEHIAGLATKFLKCID